MPQMQDVFWGAFADEVEKLAGWKGKAALAAGGAAGLAALASGGKKQVDKAKGVVANAGKTQRARLSAQTGEEY